MTDQSTTTHDQGPERSPDVQLAAGRAADPACLGAPCLLDRALPGWHDALRTGGTIGLAYNRHVAGPEAMAEALEAHGLTVVHGHGVDGPTQGHVAADAFRHRVDASIDRDIVVARKG